MVVNTYLKIVLRLSLRDNITEAQIRNFLADTEPKLRSRVTALVANAPVVAEAVLENMQLKLKVDPVEPGAWAIYPKLGIDVSVADGITEAQVFGYLESYWDQAKIDLRSLIASIPTGAQAQILEWHVHRLTGSTDEVEN